MDDDRQAFEFAYALYLTRQVDRESAQIFVQAAEAEVIGIEQATAGINCLATSILRRVGSD